VLRGRQKYYALNKDYPLMRQVFAILRRTVGVAPTISDAIRKVPGIDAAYLYGSFAKEEEDAASDVDILIVGKPDSNRLATAASRLEKLLNREINYTVITDRELKHKVAAEDPFISDIWNGKRIALATA
jgi:predicted nucleotidyltransferase